MNDSTVTVSLVTYIAIITWSVVSVIIITIIRGYAEYLTKGGHFDAAIFYQLIACFGLVVTLLSEVFITFKGFLQTMDAHMSLRGLFWIMFLISYKRFQIGVIKTLDNKEI